MGIGAMQGSALPALATARPEAADPTAPQARRLQGASAGRDTEAVKKAARDFEAVFVTQMLQHMFEGIGEDTLFGGGQGEQMFRSVMLDEYGKIIANHGNGIGIAAHVQRELLKTQEVQ